jgi:glutamate formiminotransferase/formiminotetrahydrofolate cyclodeaminase
LQLESFRRDQVLELRLKRPPISEGTTIGTFFDQVAAGTPTPGGGTVAAVAGALASCLAVMVANLTIGKKKYAGSEVALREAKRQSEAARRELLALARADSEAFDAVLRAGRLPQGTAAEQSIREKALGEAVLAAARVPLETAECCLNVVRLASQAAQLGNVQAVTDAGVAGLLAKAAGEGALLNVEINLKSMAAGADKNGVETDLRRLEAALARAAEECRGAVGMTRETS